MKKVLSFVLVLAMILGSVSMAFAAPYTSAMKKMTADNTAVPFADAEDSYVATILRDLGAVDGDGANNVNPKGELTRAEGYAMIVKAMGLKEMAVQQATKFTDVAKDAWYSGYVAVAAAQGYTDGTGNNKFSPDAKMSKDEAVAAVLKVLGYDAKHLAQAWPVNYRDLALGMGILNDVNTGSDVATRADMMQVIYNCLFEEFKVWQDSSFLAGNIVGGSFQPATNHVTLIQRMTGISAPYVYVTGAAANASVGWYYDTFANGFDITKYNGKNVALLYKKFGTTQVPMGISAVASKTLEGNFVKDKPTTFKAIDGTLYTVAADAVTKGATVFYTNNAKDTPHTYDIFTTNASTGLITAAKTSSVAMEVKFDTEDPTLVIEIKSVVNNVAKDSIMVSKTNVEAIERALVNKTNRSTVSLLGTTFATTKSGVYYVPDTTKFTVEGDATTLAEIQEDDVVTIYEYGGSGNAWKVVVTRKTDEGVISKINGTTTLKYTINGAEYAKATDFGNGLASSYAKTPIQSDIKLGNSFKVFLDEDGKIFACKQVTGTSSTTQYGFVLNTYFNPAGAVVNGKTISTASIQLYNVLDGTTNTYDVASVSAFTTNFSGFFNEAEEVDAWQNDAAAGKALSYLLDKDGKLVTVAACSTLEGPVSAAAFEQYVTLKTASYTTPANFASDAVVVLKNADAKNNVNSAKYYGTLAVADIVNATWNNAGYLLDEDDKVCVLVVSKTDKQNFVVENTTMFGFVTNFDTFGEEVVLDILANGETKTYKTVGGTLAITPSYGTFYKITLVDGEVSGITTANAVSSAVVGYTHVKFDKPTDAVWSNNMLTLAGDCVTAVSTAAIGGSESHQADATMMVAAAPAVYVYNATTKVYEYAGNDATLIELADEAWFFDLNMKNTGEFVGDGVVDTIVIINK